MIQPTNLRQQPLVSLAFNHLDAWVVTTAIVVSALLVHARLAVDTLPLLLVMGGAYWLAFALNDYFDAPLDRLDERKVQGNFFARTGASNRWFWGLAAGFLGLTILVLGRYGGWGVGVIVVGGIVAWSYSAPPLRLKDRPGLDILTHAVFVESYPYAAVLLLLGVAWSALDAFILGVLFLSSISAQLEQQLRDYDLDKLTGRTFATVAGRPLTHRLLVVATIGLLGGAALYYLSADVPAYLVPFGVMALPILFHRLLRGPDRARSPWLVTVTALIGLGYSLWLVGHHFLLGR